ncbi:esterase/lipase family protein [Enterococcus sp. LJL51]|uniref:esterase/lipase family protein n=1 Tax=Enterococcus sp. LJL51 TaxID=3416656 RepID=UPI003CF98C2D
MKKKHLYYFIVGVCLFLGIGFFQTEEVHGENKDPHVFVHGLVGFGPDELKPFPITYWGGFSNILGDLNAKGYTSLEAIVSPFGSNWDRAVELYYYIKGGTVDYGAAHAQKHGHDRYGRTFPGIYPQWDGQHKIHLIGHSQGGQTSRVLETLLREGSAEEQSYAAANGTDVSELFQGNKNWVHSITTLGTPHNGTKIADVAKPLISDLIYSLAAATGSSKSKIPYDFKLDQWGLRQRTGESNKDYMKRVLSSNVWNNSQDIALHDLTVAGSDTINQMTNLAEDVYYFSFAGDATYKSGISSNYLPFITMSPLFTIPSSILGKTGTVEWRANDGLVPVISAKAPFTQKSKVADNQMEPGIWYVEPVIKGWDHIDFIGQDYLQAPLLKKDVRAFYEKIVQRNYTI